MYLMLIQTVKLKLESDMPLEIIFCEIWITYKEFDNTRCLAVLTGILIKRVYTL